MKDMYALVNNQSLLLGPIQFRPGMINSEIEDVAEEYNVQIQKTVVLNDESQVPLNIFTDDDVDLWILPAEINQPNYDPIRQFLSGPVHQITSQQKVSFNWTVQDKSLEQIKTEVISQIPAVRYDKEQIGIVTCSIEGQDIELSTSRENRLALSIKASTGIGTFNYKFGENWISVSPTDLQSILTSIDSKVQEFFDWELSIKNEINSCADVDSVLNIAIRESRLLGVALNEL